MAILLYNMVGSSIRNQNLNQYKEEIRRWYAREKLRGNVYKNSVLPVIEHLLKIQERDNLSNRDIQRQFDEWYKKEHTPEGFDVKVVVNEDIDVFTFAKLIPHLRGMNNWITEQFKLSGGNRVPVLRIVEYLRNLQKFHGLSDFDIRQIFNARFCGKYDLDEHLDVCRFSYSDPPSTLEYNIVAVPHNPKWKDPTWEESGNLISEGGLVP